MPSGDGEAGAAGRPDDGLKRSEQTTAEFTEPSSARRSGRWLSGREGLDTHDEAEGASIAEVKTPV